jgi:hypothetical protein
VHAARLVDVARTALYAFQLASRRLPGSHAGVTRGLTVNHFERRLGVARTFP